MTKKKLKIAVFHNLPSGGAKRSLHMYINYLTSRGHIVDVFIPSTANEDYLPLRGIASNIVEYEVKGSFFRNRIYSMFSYVPAIIKKESVSNVMSVEKKIAEDINSLDYDIVYCEQDQFTMTPVILQYLKKPTVYYCQQPIRKDDIIKKVNKHKKRTGFFSRPIIRQLADYYVGNVESNDYERDYEFAQYAKHLLANSYFSHESILKQYGKNARVSYIGVDTRIFRPLGLPRDKFVLSVGTCIPPKGYDFLIRSLANIQKESRPKLVIVGNDSDEGWVNYLKSLASKLTVKLDIRTQISDEKLVELYNRAMLVVYAPYLEPFGYVPLEAMACGTPVVGVREGGLRESIVHNRTGLLTPRDERDFAKAIVKLLTNYQLWRECAHNGINYINSYWTLEKAGERLLNNLYRVIEKEEKR